GGGDRTAQVWDVAARARRALLSHPAAEVTFTAFTPDGQTLLTRTRGSNVVKVWDLARQAGRDLALDHRATVAQVALSPDGKTLASGSFELLKLSDVATGREEAALPLSLSWLHSLAFSPDGTALAVGGTALRVLDLATRRERATAPATHGVASALTWSGGGAALAAALPGRAVQVWDAATGNLRRSLGSQGYTFLLAPPGRGAERGWRLQILRNGLRQREQDVTLPPGPVRLLAGREGNRLHFQVNDLPPLEFHDLFPLSEAQPGAPGVSWPAGARLTRLRAARQALPAAGSPLERADDAYAQGRHAEALELYQEQAIASGSQEAGAEARLKAALCLAELNRAEDAARLFERVAGAPGRWAPVAACQLWLLRLRQDRPAEADAVFESLA